MPTTSPNRTGSQAASLLKPTLILAIAAIFAVLVAGCGGGDETTSTTRVVDEGLEIEGEVEPGTCEDIEAPGNKSISLDEPEPGQVLEEGDEAVAVVETTCGTFRIALDTDRAPLTANSFAFMAQEGLFDDLGFHRVVPDFVIQGGDTDGSGNGGPGYQIVEEPPADLSYTRGIVAMAKTGFDPPGTSGSQFFVVTAADAGLPPEYALLGEVVEGIEVVDLISMQADPGTDGPPNIPVAIKSITIETSS